MGNDIDKIVEDAMGEIGKYYSLVHAVTLKNADQLIRDILRSACEKAREMGHKEYLDAHSGSCKPPVNIPSVFSPNLNRDEPKTTTTERTGKWIKGDPQ